MAERSKLAADAIVEEDENEWSSEDDDMAPDRPKLTQDELNAALFQAVKDRQATTVATLLEDGADPVCRDEQDWTPLVWAGFVGAAECVPLLAEAGAADEYRNIAEELLEPSERGEDGVDGFLHRRTVNSPLHWAAWGGHLPALWALLEAGVSTVDVDKFGNNALHLAAAGGRTDVVRSLLYAGVDVHGRNLFGNTAIHLARTPALRKLLVDIAEQKVCASTDAVFGPHELRYVCHSTGKAYAEESSSAALVHATASLQDHTLMPVRFSNDAEYRVGDVEAALDMAMRPGSRAGDMDFGAPDELAGPAAPGSATSQATQAEGGAEPAAPAAMQWHVPAALAGVRDELSPAEAHVLARSVSAAKEANASLKLIAAGEAMLERCAAWHALVAATNETIAARPVARRSELAPLMGALAAAQEAGVSKPAISAVQGLLQELLGEVELTAAVQVAARITAGDHGVDGDVARLRAAVRRLSLDSPAAQLIAQAQELAGRLDAEISMRDALSAAQRALDDARAAVLAEDEDQVNPFEAQYPTFPELYEPAEPEDGGKPAKKPKKKKKKSAEPDPAAEALRVYWPRGATKESYDPANDPANDRWLAENFGIDLVALQEAAAAAAAGAAGSGKPGSRGGGMARSKKPAEPEEEPPLVMPPATPALVALRDLKRQLSDVDMAVQTARSSGSDPDLVASAEDELLQLQHAVDETRAEEIARVTVYELDRKKKKKKKGKKSKPKA